MIIEPCCIPNQLPALLKERSDVIFYSNGDWGIERLMFSVDCLVESPSIEVLLCPAVDLSLCRYLRKSLQKSWAKGVFVCTARDCADLVSGELQGYTDKVLYVHRANLNAQAYIRYNAKEAIAICGPMFVGEVQGGFCLYNGISGHGRKFKELMEGVVPLFATKSKTHFLSEVKQNFLNRKYE